MGQTDSPDLINKNYDQKYLSQASNDLLMKSFL